MWKQSALTKKLGIDVPIIQAPMAGGPTTPQLVAAVSSAGGLGSLGAGYMSANGLQRAIRDIRELTDRPFAVNLFIPTDFNYDEPVAHDMASFLDTISESPSLKESMTLPNPAAMQKQFEDQLEVVIQEQVPVFSFTFGSLHTDLINQLQGRGTVVVGTATTVEEARTLEQSGVDAVVVQGAEAGGHRGSFLTESSRTDLNTPALIGLMALLPQIADVVRVPIIASGGIMDGRGIAASFVLGAQGVQMGTAFLPTEESGAHPSYKAALFDSKSEDTVVTRAFSGKFARGIQNSFIRQVEGYEGDIPDYPIQNALTRPIRNWASEQAQPDYMSLWAGQALPLVRNLPAAALVSQLIKETDAVFDRMRQS
ncbi:nitronate monooxygenase [Alicyclobacillus ferrooxydans]|uniref:Probable nitronate monooxygenase n=1 Tax=Alicyclobacillus ferrooxydans TaxID=471514 RepID=A0A0P9CXN8_9BACL|nr:nitronate monooxygenase [Alicyclobacillus ferrooxydans]KPV44531.1 nitronate monooxygenase [Alicyclobacillus ferrooxydans]